MKTKIVTYFGGAFDPGFPENTAIVLKQGHKIKLNNEDKDEVEVADLLVFDENGGQHLKRNVQHEDDKIEASHVVDGDKKECHHPYYEED